MTTDPRRIRREKKTVAVMLEMYCRAKHDADGNGLCAGCQALHDYAMDRIDKCPFCLAKPTCANCPIHCYKRDMRAEVKTVMAWSGPRMMRRHPILAVLHVLDGRRRVELPVRKSRDPKPEGRIQDGSRPDPS